MAFCNSNWYSGVVFIRKGNVSIAMKKKLIACMNNDRCRY
jgi:hypothetical protein